MRLPNILAVMTLEKTVFFPHMLLPLHVQAGAYQNLLDDALADSRLFAVNSILRPHESPSSIGTVGLIRACAKQSDGSAKLLLQGLQRVRLNFCPRKIPYWVAQITPLRQRRPRNLAVAQQLVEEIHQIINHFPKTCSCTEFLHEFLSQTTSNQLDCNTLVDILAGHLLSCPRQKQLLLEGEDPSARLALLTACLREAANYY